MLGVFLEWLMWTMVGIAIGLAIVLIPLFIFLEKLFSSWTNTWFWRR